MKKVDWYIYIKWSEEQKAFYPYTLINSKNEVQCYEESEKSKFKLALKRKQNNE